MSEHIRMLVRRFVATGRHQGDGVDALLSNDLEKAVALLDVTPQELVDLVRWLICHIPADAHGSKKNTRRWARKLHERQEVKRKLIAQGNAEPTDKQIEYAVNGARHSIYIDADLRDELLDYQQTGRELSHFPMACLEGDLMNIATRGDGVNLAELREIMQFIYSYLEPSCYGSKTSVEHWTKMGGRDGINARLKEEKLGA